MDPWSRKGCADDLSTEQALQTVPPVSDLIGDAPVLPAGGWLGPDQECLAGHDRTEAVGDEPVADIDLREADAARHLEARMRRALHRLLHEVRPHRQRGLGAAQPVCVAPIEADPPDGEQARGVAHEPRVATIVGRSGLARDRAGHAEAADRRAGAGLDHALYERGNRTRLV